MTYFNDDIMKHILGYCGRTIEEERDYLWKHIAIRRTECRWEDDDELPYCIIYDGVEKKDNTIMRRDGVLITKEFMPRYKRVIQYDATSVNDERLDTINLSKTIDIYRIKNDIANANNLQLQLYNDQKFRDTNYFNPNYQEEYWNV